MLLNVLKEEVYDLILNLCLPTQLESKKYSELTLLLAEDFQPSLSVFAASNKFYNSRKSTNQSAREWSVPVRNAIL